MIDEPQAIPACRVLMQGGVPCDYTITERPAPEPTPFLVTDERVVSTPKPRRYRMPLSMERILELRLSGMSHGAIGQELGCSHQTIMKRLAKYKAEHPEFVDVKVPTGPPPTGTRPKKRGRGQDWSLRHDITAERIREMRESGMLLKDIAREFNCSTATLIGRLRKERNATSEKCSRCVRGR